MYYLNKIVGAFLNPLGIGLLLMLLSLGLSLLATRARFFRVVLVLAFAWLWFWSTGTVGRWVGLPLEREFPPQLAEAMPVADAIVVLGGGTGIDTNQSPYAELYVGGDRVLHGARLYKAGKAPRVFVTCESDAAALVELGVPRAAIAVNGKARNTEEEARFIVETMGQVKDEGQERNHRVLLVTSAWHMRRAKLMYERYAKGIEVIPAATDYETMVSLGRPLEFKDFVPDPAALGHNAYMFKEWIGYWGYKWLRK